MARKYRSRRKIPEIIGVCRKVGIVLRRFKLIYK